MKVKLSHHLKMAEDFGGHLRMADVWCAIKKEWRIEERAMAIRMAEDRRAPGRCYSSQSSAWNGPIQQSMAPIYCLASK